VKYPISTITNIFYATVACFAPWPVAIALAALAVGSVAFHLYEDRKDVPSERRRAYQKADEIGMFAVFIALIVTQMPVHPAASVLGLVLLVVMGVMHEDFDKYAIGLLFAVAVIAKASAAGWPPLLILPVFGIAYIIRQFGEGRAVRWQRDALHGAWHLVTAAGFGLFVWL